MKKLQLGRIYQVCNVSYLPSTEGVYPLDWATIGPGDSADYHPPTKSAGVKKSAADDYILTAASALELELELGDSSVDSNVDPTRIGVWVQAFRFNIDDSLKKLKRFESITFISKRYNVTILLRHLCNF